MPDRIAEIRARLDAASWRNRDGWEVGWDARAAIVGVRGGDFDDADLIAHAPADIAWLLERFEAMRRALGTLAEMASWDGSGVGRKSLDDTLRYYGLSLSEVETTE